MRTEWRLLFFVTVALESCLNLNKCGFCVEPALCTRITVGRVAWGIKVNACCNNRNI